VSSCFSKRVAFELDAARASHSEGRTPTFGTIDTKLAMLDVSP